MVVARVVVDAFVAGVFKTHPTLGGAADSKNSLTCSSMRG